MHRSKAHAAVVICWVHYSHQRLEIDASPTSWMHISRQVTYPYFELPDMASHSCSLCTCPILFSFLPNALSFHALSFVHFPEPNHFFITISCNLPMWQSLSTPSYFFFFSLHIPAVCDPLCLSQGSITRWLLCINLMNELNIAFSPIIKIYIHERIWYFIFFTIVGCTLPLSTFVLPMCKELLCLFSHNHCHDSFIS